MTTKLKPDASEYSWIPGFFIWLGITLLLYLLLMVGGNLAGNLSIVEWVIYPWIVGSASYAMGRHYWNDYCKEKLGRRLFLTISWVIFWWLALVVFYKVLDFVGFGGITDPDLPDGVGPGGFFGPY